MGSAVLLRLSDLAALCIEVVPKYRLHCSLPSSAEMSQIFVRQAMVLNVEVSAWLWLMGRTLLLGRKLKGIMRPHFSSFLTQFIIH